MKLTISIIVFLLIIAGAAALLLRNKAVLDARAQQRERSVPVVRVQPVESGSTERSLALLGTLEAWRSVDVRSETQGRVTALPLDRGSQVQQGTVLAAVDSGVARSSAAAAGAALRKARADLRRYEALHAAGNASDVDLEQARLSCSEAEARAEAAQKILRDCVVRAPFAGIVAERHAEIGSMLTPGAPVVRIVDIHRFRLRVSVAAGILPLLRHGMTVTVRPDAPGAPRLSGRILCIAPEADAMHLYEIEASVENPGDAGLRAGMMAEMLLESRTEPAMLAPRTAVVHKSDGAWVYVLESGRAMRRSVTLGRENGTAVEVLSGLKEGELLIVSSHQTLRDGIAVEIRSTESGRAS